MDALSNLSGATLFADVVAEMPAEVLLANSAYEQAASDAGSITARYDGVLGPSVAACASAYFYDFYYRIWVFPNYLQLRNPREFVDIPIGIWNAHPTPVTGNDLLSITHTGGSGIIWDQVPPTTFKPIEYREVNFQVTPEAPIRVEAYFTFDFERGAANFNLRIDRASIVQMIPDVPIRETWEFLTDVIVTHDGQEQRIGLRAAPRRSLEFTLTILNSAEWRTQYKRLFADINSQLIMPFWQYNSALKQKGVQGSTTLIFDPKTTDLRVDEFVLIVRRKGGSQLTRVTALTETGCSVDTPLEYDYDIGDLVAPALPCKFENRSSVGMFSIDVGKANFKALSLEPRQDHNRPGGFAPTQWMENLLILDRRPMWEGNFPYVFDGGGEVIDNETGVLEIKSSWRHPQVEGVRKFMIPRMKQTAEMDFWRYFASYCDGRRTPFLVPAWRHDVRLYQQPENGSGFLLLEGSDYLDLYFPHEPWKRLAIETTSGMIYRRVTKAELQEDGNTLVTLETALDPDVGRVERVGYLLRCRLGTDTMTLEHHQLHSFIEFVIRSVDE